MKKILAAILALALALGGVGFAQEPIKMRIVTCSEQRFSTLCKLEYDYSFTPDGGVLIELEPDGDSWVQIFKTDAPGTNFDAEFYLGNIYPQQIKDSSDEVVSVGDYTSIALGGKELTAVTTLYLVDGVSRYSLCAFDLQTDYFVRYEARCEGMDISIEDTLAALAVAVSNFQPDADYYNR